MQGQLPTFHPGTRWEEAGEREEEAEGDDETGLGEQREAAWRHEEGCE